MFRSAALNFKKKGKIFQKQRTQQNQGDSIVLDILKAKIPNNSYIVINSSKKVTIKCVSKTVANEIIFYKKDIEEALRKAGIKTALVIN